MYDVKEYQEREARVQPFLAVAFEKIDADTMAFQISGGHLDPHAIATAKQGVHTIAAGYYTEGDAGLLAAIASIRKEIGAAPPRKKIRLQLTLGGGGFKRKTKYPRFSRICDKTGEWEGVNVASGN